MANNQRKGKKEIEELENEFNKLSNNNTHSKGAKYAAAGSRTTTVLIICICILAVAAIIGGILIFTLNGGNKFNSDLTILGVQVQGMSKDEAADAISAEFNKLYANPITVSIDDTDIQIAPGISNVTLDAEGAIQAAIKAGKNADSFDLAPYITFETASVRQLLEDASPAFTSTLTQTQAEVVGTAPADLLKIDENANLTLKVTKGTPGKKLDFDILLDSIRQAYSNGEHTVTYEIPVSEPDPVDLTALRAEYCSEPVEGEFEEKTFKVLGGTYGYAFDIDAVNTALSSALPGSIVEIPFTWTKPEKSAEDLNSLLFRDKLSTYTTRAGSQGNRDVNIELASAAVNGTILYPGDVFSYNGIVGERTPEKGYKPGATYIGGQTVMTYGGGICQVSTTLYYCTIVADLEVVERECHAYPSSYTPLSTDATVFWGGIDYKFRNNTDYPIRIDAYSDNGDVTVTFYGTDTKDYYIEFDSVHLATYPYEVVYEEMPADNEKGYKDGDVITSPYTGYKSEGWAIKYSKETGKEIERIKVSTDVYSTRDKVVVKIVGNEEENPTEPEPTDPEPSEPTPSEPTPTDPTPSEPTPSEPQPSDPQPSEPTGSEDGGNDNEDSGSETNSVSSNPIELPMIRG